MRKLSEIKGEEALDVLAEIIEPAAEIFTDENVKNAQHALFFHIRKLSHSNVFTHLSLDEILCVRVLLHRESQRGPHRGRSFPAAAAAAQRRLSHHHDDRPRAVAAGVLDIFTLSPRRQQAFHSLRQDTLFRRQIRDNPRTF